MRKLRHLGTLLSEIWAFARLNKAWWLIPLIVILLLVAALIISGQVATPFIYTLF